MARAAHASALAASPVAAVVRKDRRVIALMDSISLRFIANPARSDKAANSFNRKYVKAEDRAQPQLLMSLARLQVSLVLRFIVR